MAIRMTWFVIIMLIISVVLGYFIPETNRSKTQKENSSTIRGRDNAESK